MSVLPNHHDSNVIWRRVEEADIYGTRTPHAEINKWSCLPPRTV